MSHDWRDELAACATLPVLERIIKIKAVLLAAGGTPYRLRDARRGLFLLATSASQGTPKIIDLDGRHIALVCVDDLAEILGRDLIETFFKAVAQVPRRPRRRVKNR
jgi:hypothetical protein